MYAWYLRTKSSAAALDQTNITPFIINSQCAWDVHGCASASVTLQADRDTLYTLYARPGAYELVLTWLGAIIWRGRIVATELDTINLTLTASGNWNLLTDTPYTAVWVENAFDAWFVPLAGGIYGTSVNPGAYTYKSDVHWYWTLVNDVIYGGSIGAAEINWQAPDRATKSPSRIGFTFEMDLPTGWNLQWGYRNPTTGVITLLGTQAANDTVQNLNVVSNTLGDAEHTLFFIRAICTTSAAVYTGQPGDHYVRITNLRLWNQSAGFDVISGMCANIAQTSGLTFRLVGAGFSNLLNTKQVFQDTNKQEILEALAASINYNVFVDLTNNIVFAPKTSYIRTWMLKAVNIRIARDIDRMYNGAYVVYKNDSNRTYNAARTTTSIDPIQQARWGITRIQAVSIDTFDITDAFNTYLPIALLTGNVPPTAQFDVDMLYSTQGEAIPLHTPRPGDILRLTQLPPNVPDVDNIRQLTVNRVALMLQRGNRPQLTIEPLNAAPTLETLIARITT